MPNTNSPQLYYQQHRPLTTVPFNEMRPFSTSPPSRSNAVPQFQHEKQFKAASTPSHRKITIKVPRLRSCFGDADLPKLQNCFGADDLLIPRQTHPIIKPKGLKTFEKTPDKKDDGGYVPPGLFTSDYNLLVALRTRKAAVSNRAIKRAISIANEDNKKAKYTNGLYQQLAADEEEADKLAEAGLGPRSRLPHSVRIKYRKHEVQEAKSMRRMNEERKAMKDFRAAQLEDYTPSRKGKEPEIQRIPSDASRRTEKEMNRNHEYSQKMLAPTLSMTTMKLLNAEVQKTLKRPTNPTPGRARQPHRMMDQQEFDKMIGNTPPDQHKEVVHNLEQDTESSEGDHEDALFTENELDSILSGMNITEFDDCNGSRRRQAMQYFRSGAFNDNENTGIHQENADNLHKTESTFSKLGPNPPQPNKNQGIKEKASQTKEKHHMSFDTAPKKTKNVYYLNHDGTRQLRKQKNEFEMVMDGEQTTDGHKKKQYDDDEDSLMNSTIMAKFEKLGQDEKVAAGSVEPVEDPLKKLYAWSTSINGPSQPKGTQPTPGAGAFYDTSIPGTPAWGDVTIGIPPSAQPTLSQQKSHNLKDFDGFDFGNGFGSRPYNVSRKSNDYLSDVIVPARHINASPVKAHPGPKNSPAPCPTPPPSMGPTPPPHDYKLLENARQNLRSPFSEADEYFRRNQRSPFREGDEHLQSIPVVVYQESHNPGAQINRTRSQIPTPVRHETNTPRGEMASPAIPVHEHRTTSGNYVKTTAPTTAERRKYVVREGKLHQDRLVEVGGKSTGGNNSSNKTDTPVPRAVGNLKFAPKATPQGKNKNVGTKENIPPGPITPDQRTKPEMGRTGHTERKMARMENSKPEATGSDITGVASRIPRR